MAIKNAFVSCGREEFSIEVGGLARNLQDYFGCNSKSSEDLTSELNITAFPTIVIINSNRKVVFIHEGFTKSDAAVIDEAISNALKN